MAGKKIIEEGGVKTLWKRIRTALSGKADSAHTHTTNQISGLEDMLGGNLRIPENLSSNPSSVSVGQAFCRGYSSTGSYSLPKGGSYVVFTSAFSGGYAGNIVSGGTQLFSYVSGSDPYPELRRFYAMRIS